MGPASAEHILGRPLQQLAGLLSRRSGEGAPRRIEESRPLFPGGRRQSLGPRLATGDLGPPAAAQAGAVCSRWVRPRLSSESRGTPRGAQMRLSSRRFLRQLRLDWVSSPLFLLLHGQVLGAQDPGPSSAWGLLSAPPSAAPLARTLLHGLQPQFIQLREEWVFPVATVLGVAATVHAGLGGRKGTSESQSSRGRLATPTATCPGVYSISQKISLPPQPTPTLEKMLLSWKKVSSCTAPLYLDSTIGQLQSMPM